MTGNRTMTALRNTGATTVLTLASGADLRTNGILNGATTLLTVAPGTGGVVTTPSGGDLYITAGSGAITVSAPVTNGGGTTNLVKSGSGLVILSAANNTFGGNMAVNAGTLQIGVSGSNAQLSGGTYGGNIFIAGGAALTLTGNSSNTLSGVISGDGNLNLIRGSTTLTGANTYTGKTTIGLVATNAVGNTVSVSSFNSVVGGTASSSLGAPTTVANGTIDFGGGVQVTATLNYTGSGETTDRIINFLFNGNSNRVIDSSASGLLKFTSAPVSNGTNSSVILQGSGNGEFVQGLPFSFNNLTKSGAGTWTLGGAVGSTGILTVSASGGTLALQQRSSLMGGNNANWTAAKVVVNTGATLALNVGGTGEFNNTDVTTLLGTIGGAINNNGLRSGSTIGFDTTNASGGTFTIGNNIANPTGTGSGAIGLVKRGTGTLSLSGDNSYTGATTIRGGTLEISGSGDINSTSGVTVASGATLLQNSSVALTAPLTISAGALFGGTGEVQGSFVFGVGSSLYVEDFNTPFTVSSGTVSFADTFGIANLAGFDWNDVAPDTYTLIAGTVDDTNLINVGSGNAVDVGGGKSAYFQIGSLELVVVPEPGTLALLGAGAIAGLAVYRRRKPA